VSAAGNRILNTRQVAEILGYASPDSLRIAVRKGRAPKPIKVNCRRNVWRQSDLDAYIANLKSVGEGDDAA
jgi:predicted DNA-binding transcriptional regulator AlpA